MKNIEFEYSFTGLHILTNEEKVFSVKCGSETAAYAKVCHENIGWRIIYL